MNMITLDLPTLHRIGLVKADREVTFSAADYDTRKKELVDTLVDDSGLDVPESIGRRARVRDSLVAEILGRYASPE